MQHGDKQMPSNDDLFAGLEVQGKLVSGGQPTVSVSEKSEPVDNSDLFEGLDVGKEAIPQVAPKAVDRGFLDVVTGSERIAARPELGTLPEFGGTEEGDTPKIALGLLSTFDPKAQQDIILSSIPEAKFETFDDGTTIIEVPTADGGTRRSVLNRPGFSPQDVTTAAAQVLSFLPVARVAGIGKTLLQKVGIGAAGSAATEQGLQEVGVALGRKERDPTATLLAAGLGGAAEAVVPAVQAFRGSRQAKALGAGREDLEQIAPTVQAATEATEATGVPLFQAQQTLVPTLLERQAFVAQLPAGTQSAIKGLRAQNKAASDAVEDFIGKIAPDEAVVTGAEKVRTAAQNAIAKVKNIRAEKASPLYKQAFKEGADVDLKPVNDLIDAELLDLPESGEISKSLIKIKSLIKGPKSAPEKGPSLRLLHNAKLEIDQMINKFGENSLGNTTKAKLRDVQSSLLRQIDDASDSYRAARETFEAGSPAVTKIQDSIIGKIAGLKDDQLKQVSTKIFDPAQTNPKVLLQAKKAISDTDPDAWNQIVRVEMERRLGSIKSIQDSVTVENIPGQLFRALFPNEKSTKVLMSALDESGKKNLELLQTSLGRARLGRASGSQTAAREEIKRELRGGIGLSIRDWLKNPITTLVETGGDAAFNKRVSTLSTALFDPAWKAEMKKIRAMKTNSPAIARAMTQLLDDVEKSDAKKDSQKQGVLP